MTTSICSEAQNYFICTNGRLKKKEGQNKEKEVNDIVTDGRTDGQTKLIIKQT